jgi:hypothetical protein
MELSQNAGEKQRLGPEEQVSAPEEQRYVARQVVEY